jgi:hypothetical protein
MANRYNPQQAALTQALGSNASGYGPGGVQNPEYQQQQPAAQGNRGSGQPVSGTLPLGQAQNQGQNGHITRGGTRPTEPLVQQQPTPGSGQPGIAAQPPGGQFQTSGQGLSMDGLNGFDANNFNDPQMQSVKYRFARLAQKAGARTPQQMAALVLSPEFQREFPGSTFNGKDVVNFNGAMSDGPRGGVAVGEVDVLQAADQNANTANGIWWGPIEQQMAQSGGAMGNPMDSTGLPMQLAQQFFSGDGSNLQLMEMLKLLQSGNAHQGFY